MAIFHLFFIVKGETSVQAGFFLQNFSVKKYPLSKWLSESKTFVLEVSWLYIASSHVP